MQTAMPLCWRLQHMPTSLPRKTPLQKVLRRYPLRASSSLRRMGIPAKGMSPPFSSHIFALCTMCYPYQQALHNMDTLGHCVHCEQSVDMCVWSWLLHGCPSIEAMAVWGVLTPALAAQNDHELLAGGRGAAQGRAEAGEAARRGAARDLAHPGVL